MDAARPVLTGWLEERDNHPLWPGIHDLLLPAAQFGNCPVLNEGDEVWIAVDNGTVIGAVTARALADGDAEIMNVGGVNASRWWAQVTAQIEAWAKANGARRIHSQGRRGWWRWIKAQGWKRVRDDGQRSWYEKDLV